MDERSLAEALLSGRVLIIDVLQNYEPDYYSDYTARERIMRQTVEVRLEVCDSYESTSYISRRRIAEVDRPTIDPRYLEKLMTVE